MCILFVKFDNEIKSIYNWVLKININDVNFEAKKENER